MTFCISVKCYINAALNKEHSGQNNGREKLKNEKTRDKKCQCYRKKPYLDLLFRSVNINMLHLPQTLNKRNM